MARRIGIVTALKPVLGYDEATGLGAEALATDEGLLERVREKGLVSQEQVQDLLDPRKMTGR